MADCDYKSSLEPYYDGELGPERAGAFERHLRECPTCPGELQKMHELSLLIASARPREMTAGELAGVHDAVDEVANRSIFRFAVGLSAIAASILIISAAWLYDGPPPAGRVLVSEGQPTEQAWEKWASAGRIDNLPVTGEVAPETAVAERKATEWMAVSLGVPTTK